MPKPVARLIEVTAELYSAAKSGQLRALATAEVRYDPDARFVGRLETSSFADAGRDRNDLLAAVLMLDHKIKQDAFDQKEEADADH